MGDLVDLKPYTVDLNRYLVDPKCETVDYVDQLDLSKHIGGLELESIELNHS